MKLFVVHLDVDYEHGEVIGVCSSPEMAKQHALEYIADDADRAHWFQKVDRDGPYWKNGSAYITIQPCELDRRIP